MTTTIWVLKKRIIHVVVIMALMGSAGRGFAKHTVVQNLFYNIHCVYSIFPNNMHENIVCDQ